MMSWPLRRVPFTRPPAFRPRSLVGFPNDREGTHLPARRIDTRVLAPAACCEKLAAGAHCANAMRQRSGGDRFRPDDDVDGGMPRTLTWPGKSREQTTTANSDVAGRVGF